MKYGGSPLVVFDGFPKQTLDFQFNLLFSWYQRMTSRHIFCAWNKTQASASSQEHRGHQSSGARAPELWCPHIFFGVFLMVFSNLCWQCSNKTRKCQEHINTLRKKEKLIFLMPILEIKTKNLFSAGKGTRVLVPGHQNSGAPSFFGGFLDGVLTFMLAVFWKNQEMSRTHKYTKEKREIDIPEAYSRY